jgi:hypothetical protein
MEGRNAQNEEYSQSRIKPNLTACAGLRQTDARFCERALSHGVVLLFELEHDCIPNLRSNV